VGVGIGDADEIKSRGPQGLKPALFVRSGGTAEDMHFPKPFKQQRNSPSQRTA
jgi:hypothetical protein